MTIISQEVQEFAEAMQRVLDKHKDRGDTWKQCSFDYLQSRMIDEVRETREDDPKISEWIDVANFCMMIYLTSVHNYNQEAAKGGYVSRKGHPEDTRCGLQPRQSLGDVSGSPRKSLSDADTAMLIASRIRKGKSLVKCLICGKPMKNAIDSKTGRISPYLWQTTCEHNKDKIIGKG
jgi:hypothetical protein